MPDYGTIPRFGLELEKYAQLERGSSWAFSLWPARAILDLHRRSPELAARSEISLLSY
jgi:hypothetical protein